ncbi:hypothetical protein [Marinoscillum sp.]
MSFLPEELIDKLLFIDKVEKGLNDVEEGKSMPLQQAKDLFKSKWSK